MKKNAIYFFTAVLLLSCGSETETTTTTETTSSVDTTTTQVDTTAAVNLQEIDWGYFKSAVERNDTTAMVAFSGPDVSDPEGLLSMLREDWVWEKLSTTEYSDLADSDYNGTPVKEFVADVTGSDDEGNIYESAIFLYFEETETGLKLVNVLMAG